MTVLERAFVSNWVRNLVMLWTLAVVGVVAWIDVRAGNRPDPLVLTVPAGVFVFLYVNAKRRDREVGSGSGSTSDEEEPEE